MEGRVRESEREKWDIEVGRLERCFGGCLARSSV